MKSKTLSKAISNQLKEKKLGAKFRAYLAPPLITSRTLYNWRKLNDQGKETKLISDPAIQFYLSHGFEASEIFK